MELPYNYLPALTNYLVENGLLDGTFVVVDVGVYGGVSPRWRHLGSTLRVYGFDARAEAIAAIAPARGEHYICSAVGNYDGEAEFFTMPGGGADSSFWQGKNSKANKVKIGRLDTFLARGDIAPPDVLKVDVEGYERFVFEGAQQTLLSTLAIEFETNFNDSETYPRGHIGTIQELLIPHGFKLCELVFDRHLGIPSTFDVLFCRQPRNASEALKLAIIHEIYYHKDQAKALLEQFPPTDLAGCIAALDQSGPRVQEVAEVEILQLHRTLKDMRQSTSWKITTPLRKLKDLLG